MSPEEVKQRAQMMNPVDLRFPRRLDTLEKKIVALEKARQRPWGDWYKWNAGLFAFNSTDATTNSTLVDVNSEMPVEDFFKVGDTVWIEQTTDKYFYVLEVDDVANTITINGGDTFTFINAAFTFLAIGLVPAPSGHPKILDISTTMKVWTFVPAATYTDDSANFTGGFGSRTLKYYMDGPIVTYLVDLGTTNLRANATAVIITTPFIKRSQSSVDNKLSGTLIAGTDVSPDIHVLYQWVDSTGAPVSSDLTFDIFSRNLGAAFTAGTWAFSGNLIVNV